MQPYATPKEKKSYTSNQHRVRSSFVYHHFLFFATFVAVPSCNISSFLSMDSRFSSYLCGCDRPGWAGGVGKRTVFNWIWVHGRTFTRRDGSEDEEVDALFDLAFPPPFFVRRSKEGSLGIFRFFCFLFCLYVTCSS